MQINLTTEEVKALREWIADDDEPAPVVLSVGDGHAGFGLYVWTEDYPDEGAVFIKPLTGAQPAAAPNDTQVVIAPPSDRDPHFGGHSYDASLLRELLAVIHRDGGHYVAQHGIEKACADAAAIWLAAPAAQPADSAMQDAERYRFIKSTLNGDHSPAKSSLWNALLYHGSSAYAAAYEMDKNIDAARTLTAASKERSKTHG